MFLLITGPDWAASSARVAESAAPSAEPTRRPSARRGRIFFMGSGGREFFTGGSRTMQLKVEPALRAGSARTECGLHQIVSAFASEMTEQRHESGLELLEREKILHHAGKVGLPVQ